MKAIVIALFGEYVPLLDPITGNAVLGVAGVDWPYVLGIFLFSIVLYSFFRLVGMLLK